MNTDLALAFMILEARIKAKYEMLALGLVP